MKKIRCMNWIDVLCTDRRVSNYSSEIRENAGVQCTRIVVWLEHRDHVRDIDYTRWAVRKRPVPDHEHIQWQGPDSKCDVSTMEYLPNHGYRRIPTGRRVSDSTSHRKRNKIKTSYVARYSTWTSGARGGAGVWGSELQAGRAWVRFPTLSLEFFIDIILPAALWSRAWLSL
jgi:hypothetical protein